MRKCRKIRPIATILALYFKNSPFEFRFMSKTNFERRMLVPRGSVSVDVLPRVGKLEEGTEELLSFSNKGGVDWKYEKLTGNQIFDVASRRIWTYRLPNKTGSDEAVRATLRDCQAR